MGRTRTEAARGNRRHHCGLVLACIMLSMVSGLFAKADGPVAGPASTTTSTPPPAAMQTNASEEEVVGFFLQGRLPWEQLAAKDFGTFSVNGIRYLPLRQILNMLRAEANISDTQFTFTPDGGKLVTLNLQTHELLVAGTPQPQQFIERQSVVTNQTDYFLSIDTVAKLFEFTIAWDEQQYAFFANTSVKLAIWKQMATLPFLGQNAREIPTNLPELLPPAYPKTNGLSYTQFTTATRSSFGSSASTSKYVGVDDMQQTFWGKFAGGQFKVQLREPSMGWNSSGFNTYGDAPAYLNWMDWRYQWKHAELAAGDSSFGISDMIFPYAHVSGIRFNGLVGGKNDDDSDHAEDGLRRELNQQQMFEGTAPFGSTVELYINDRLIDTTEARQTTADDTLGTGTWRFENIDLPVGGVNTVRIIITDPHGVKTQVERNILGSALLLGKGKLAYLGAVGTNRETNSWNVHGLLGGGRVVYGINKRFTVGATAAVQDNFTDEYADPSLATEKVSKFSVHSGVELDWLPVDPLLLTANAAVSSSQITEGAKTNRDLGVKLKGDYIPSRKFGLSTQLFSYGPDFFNGQNGYLNDRKGFTTNARWRATQKSDVTFAMGMVANNVDGTLSQGLSVNYQDLLFRTSTVKNTSLSYEINRLSPDNGEQTRMLHTLSANINPRYDLSMNALVSLGDTMTIDSEPFFFNGLYLPGTTIYASPRTSLSVSKYLKNRQSYTLAYWDTSSSRNASILHNYRFGANNRTLRGFVLGTEVGNDFKNRSLLFTNRADYYWDPAGINRISLESSFDHDGWSFSLSTNTIDLFSFDTWGIHRIKNNLVNPDEGAVHGVVFSDYNGNGIPDRGEPYMENVKVTDDRQYSATTDDKGYFIMPAANRSGKERVFLDIASVPAMYSPTQGIQTAYTKIGSLTGVYLGIVPVSSISGQVNVITQGNSKPLSGVHLFITKVDSDEIITESYTAADGSYYLGDIRPGTYQLHLDNKSLPAQCTVSKFTSEIIITPGKNGHELQLPPIAISLDTPAEGK